MKRVILSTESGADLPKDLAEKYAIQVVPMHVIMDGKDYVDGSLPVKDIYDYYERTKKIPSTTSTNSHEYHDFFKKIKADFPDCTIIHIGYTSKASSSFQNGSLPAKNLRVFVLINEWKLIEG